VKVALLKLLGGILLIAFDLAEAREVHPPGRADAGAAVFKKCIACHQVGRNARNGIGPVLNGVVGQPAGQYPGYAYSAPNKSSGLIWDEHNLTFSGLKKDQELADVVAYLKQYDREGNVANP
jgi:cytochrome c